MQAKFQIAFLHRLGFQKEKYDYLELIEDIEDNEKYFEYLTSV